MNADHSPELEKYTEFSDRHKELINSFGIPDEAIHTLVNMPKKERRKNLLNFQFLNNKGFTWNMLVAGPNDAPTFTPFKFRELPQETTDMLQCTQEGRYLNLETFKRLLNKNISVEYLMLLPPPILSKMLQDSQLSDDKEQFIPEATPGNLIKQVEWWDMDAFQESIKKLNAQYYAWKILEFIINVFAILTVLPALTHYVCKKNFYISLTPEKLIHARNAHGLLKQQDPEPADEIVTDAMDALVY